MCDTQPRLVKPTESMRDAYMDFLADFEAAGENEISGGGLDPETDFAAFIRRLGDHARGAGLPDGWIPASTFWLVRGEEVLGTCNIRHGLNEKLRDFAGHIGYSVRPSQRRRGYGTLMVKLALAEARELGIERVLVTCDPGNIASVRVIENNDGVLDSESYSDQAGRVTRRYWINTDLQHPGQGVQPGPASE